MSNKTKYICLIGILIIATFFRFYHLSSTPPGLYMDEAMDGVNAQNVAQTGQFKVYYPEDNGREGLYVNMLAIAFKYNILPDTEPWSVRFPAAVAGVLTVLGTYLLVSELFKKGHRVSGIGNGQEEKETHAPSTMPYALALLSAFLLAVSFWHTNFSRIGFRAILAPFCLVWASWLLLKAIRAVSNKRAAIYAILGGIIYAAGFYTYIAFRITPLLLLLFIPFFRREPGFWKRFLLFLFVIFLVALPIGWYYLKHPADFFGRTSQISVASSGSPLAAIASNTLKTALMFNWQGDGNWRHNLPGWPELFWPVGILFLLGLVLSIYYLFKKKTGNSKFAILFFLAWFVLAALPEILSNDGIPHALRSLLMVVPAIVFAALGGVWLYAWLRTRWSVALVKTLAVIFLVVAGVGGYYEYFIAWAQNPNVQGAFNADYVQIGREINALPAGTQKYVVIYAGGVIDYGLPMPVEPVLYVTRSFVPDATAQKDVNNIHYLLPDEVGQIPAGTPTDTIFEIR
jgi:4-amino-4-deoxy-L-arabinose transferase-like glycosyltransferase